MHVICSIQGKSRNCPAEHPALAAHFLGTDGRLICSPGVSLVSWPPPARQAGRCHQLLRHLLLWLQLRQLLLGPLETQGAAESSHVPPVGNINTTDNTQRVSSGAEYNVT